MLARAQEGGAGHHDLLAFGEPATTVWANPKQVDDPRETAIAVGDALGLDPGKLYPLLADRSRGFVYLERKADPEAQVVAVDGVNVVVQSVDGFEGNALLELSDRFKQRHAPAAVVLGSAGGGGVSLVANFDPAVAERVSASDVIRAAAPLVGGGGGGRPTMARAGGKDVEKLPDALAEAERLIREAL